MMGKTSSGLWMAWGVVLGLLGGCQSKAPPPLPPEMLPAARVYPGTPVSGPTADAPQVAPADVMQVRVRWIMMHHLPVEILGPINAQSRLIIAPDSGSALAVTADLTRDVRFASGDTAIAFANSLESGELGEWQQIAADSRVVVPGATAQFAVNPAVPSVDIQPQLSLLVSPVSQHPAATQPADAVTKIDLAVNVSERITAGPRYTTGRYISETAVVDGERLAGSTRFVAAVPISDSQTPWTAIVVIATIDTTPADPADLDILQAELHHTAEIVEAGLSPTPLGDAPSLRGAISALSDPDSQRPALLLLARLCDARIAADVALVADEQQLAQLVDVTRKSVDPGALPPLADLQWFLDRTALQFMCQAAEKESLSPELQSVLALHSGDVARRPDAILAMIGQVGDSQSLRERIIAENYIALEDTSPAARVRAYDWLAARDRAPADFDPLADAKSRRAAIDQAMTQLGDQP